MRIVVFVSGGGTNLQALIDAQKNGGLGGGEIVAVISSKPDVYALERAAQNGIPSMVISRKQLGDAYEETLLSVLEEYDAQLIVLAGFLSILSEKITNAYANKIINIHPALIPSFCGKGYYGLKVHEAALEYGVKVTGATVHFVNEVPDGGAIILQKAVAIEDADTPEILQKRVMEQAEWELLPKAVSLFCQGRIKINGRKTTII